MSVILCLNIVDNRKISRCRSIERELFFQQRDGSSSNCPFHLSNAFSWAVIDQPSDANSEESLFRRGPNTLPTSWTGGSAEKSLGTRLTHRSPRSVQTRNNLKMSCIQPFRHRVVLLSSRQIKFFFIIREFTWQRLQKIRTKDLMVLAFVAGTDETPGWRN